MSEKAGLILNNEFQYNIDYLLAKALMNEEPLIVVEGIDDVEFYKKIAPDEFQVKCSELVEKSDGNNYQEGCEGVIQIVRDIQNNVNRDSRLEKFFLGIIDSDYRVYMGQIDTELKCLFVLKYYSFESHFTSENSIKKFVSNVTRASETEITSEVINILKEGTRQVETNLYYAGLESLKGRMDSSYSSIVSYDSSPEALYEENKSTNRTSMLEILDKKEELDNFAETIGVSQEDYRNIARGKWLLYSITSTVYNNIEKVKQQCNEGKIKQCDFCRQGKIKKCIWGKSKKLTRNNYTHEMIYSNLEETEIQYIKEKLKTMGAK